MSYCSNCALYTQQLAELSAQLTEARASLVESEAANRLWRAVDDQKDRQLVEAHRHLGTALEWIEGTDLDWTKELKAARAYAAAHHAGGET